MIFQKVLIADEYPPIGISVILGEDKNQNIQWGYVSNKGKLEVCSNEEWDVLFFEWWLKPI